MARRADTPSQKRARRRGSAGVDPALPKKRVVVPTSDPRPATDSAAEREALVVSHWFEAGDGHEPYSATIRLTGRRMGTTGRLTAADSFTHEETIDSVVPGSGRLSVTSWVYGLQPGTWDVSATIERQMQPAPGQPLDRRPRATREALGRAAWSWRRWAVEPRPAQPVPTRWAPLAPLARSPAVIPGSFLVLAILSFLAAIGTQTALIDRSGLPVASSLAVSLLASLAGIVGAKLWYMALQRRPWRETIARGWSVDGFLVVAPAVAVVALLVTGFPIGAFLDATAPGMFLAVGIGRIGCFFTGCCAGRCTAARWAIWSSDQRIGARRIPTQLLESGTGLALALFSGALVIGDALPVEGLAFVVSLAVYAAVRQGLLRIRSERRDYSWQPSSTTRAARP